MKRSEKTLLSSICLLALSSALSQNASAGTVLSSDGLSSLKLIPIASGDTEHLQLQYCRRLSSEVCAPLGRQPLTRHVLNYLSTAPLNGQVQDSAAVRRDLTCGIVSLAIPIATTIAGTVEGFGIAALFSSKVADSAFQLIFGGLVVGGGGLAFTLLGHDPWYVNAPLSAWQNSLFTLLSPISEIARVSIPGSTGTPNQTQAEYELLSVAGSIIRNARAYEQLHQTQPITPGTPSGPHAPETCAPLTECAATPASPQISGSSPLSREGQMDGGVL